MASGVLILACTCSSSLLHEQRHPWNPAARLVCWKQVPRSSSQLQNNPVDKTLCHAMLCRAVPCRAVLCCAVLCCAVLCCAVLNGSLCLVQVRTHVSAWQSQSTWLAFKPAAMTLVFSALPVPTRPSLIGQAPGCSCLRVLQSQSRASGAC